MSEQRELRLEAIDRRSAAILRSKSPAERLAMLEDLNTTARAMLTCAVRRRHPKADDATVARLVAELWARATD